MCVFPLLVFKGNLSLLEICLIFFRIYANTGSTIHPPQGHHRTPFYLFGWGANHTWVRTTNNMSMLMALPKGTKGGGDSFHVFYLVSQNELNRGREIVLHLGFANVRQAWPLLIANPQVFTSFRQRFTFSGRFLHYSPATPNANSVVYVPSPGAQ